MCGAMLKSFYCKDVNENDDADDGWNKFCLEGKKKCSSEKLAYI